MLHRALNPEGHDWTNTEELLAVLVEVVDLGNRMFYMAHAKPGTKQPRPVEIRRPGEKREQRQSTARDIRRVMGGAIKVVE